MKLLKDINISNDLKFKKVRSTKVGANIIDLDIDLIQTCWCKICYDVDYSICTDVPEAFEKILAKIDNKVIEHCSKVLDLCPQTMSRMYSPLLRPRGDGYYFRTPISNISVLWEHNENESGRKHYNKKEMSNILQVGHYIRFIIRLKKLYFKDNNLTLQTELLQAEYN